MSTLKVRCTPILQTIPCGAALFVETQLLNGAADPLSLPEDGSGSPFSYRLVPKSPEQDTIHISASSYAKKKFPTIKAPSGGKPRVIEPGRKYHHKEELGHSVAGNIPAGEYALIACHEADGDTLSSEPVDIRIEPLQVRGSASTYCGHRLSFAAVVAHEASDKALSIYQFESLGENALEGVWHPRNTGLAATPTSMAISSHVGNRGLGRWFAWTTGTELGAQKGRGKTTTILASSLKLDSPSIVLLDGSFDHADGSATFFAVDQTRESLLRVDASENGLTLTEVDAPWFGVPQRVIVTYDLRGDAPIVHFTWAERSGADTLVWQSSNRADDMAVVNAPLMICQRPEALLALSTPRVLRFAGRDTRELHMLWQASADGLMTCAIHRDGTSPPQPEEVRFPPPDISATQWALTQRRNSAFTVAASDGSQILLRSTANVWNVLVGGVQVESLALLTADEQRIWAQWFDKNSGYEAIDTSPPKGVVP
jgi:hypothetical protein